MRILFSTLMVTACLFVQGQSGIRFTILDFEANTGKFRPNLLLGYDRDLNDRLSIGFDIIRGYVFDRENLGAMYSTGNNSYNYNYEVSRKTWGMQYRSQYFFGGSVYLGTTIGVRAMAITMDPDAYSSYNSSSSPVLSRITERTTIIPLGLRFGLRSELDGWYGDIYLGVGYNAGAGKELFPGLGVDRKDRTMSKAWINVGYAMGVGW